MEVSESKQMASNDAQRVARRLNIEEILCMFKDLIFHAVESQFFSGPSCKVCWLHVYSLFSHSGTILVQCSFALHMQMENLGQIKV